MNSKGTLADLEAAHERVRAAKTTPEGRAKIRQACAEYTRGMVMGHQSIVLNALDIAALLDDFSALEAELAALRRVEVGVDATYAKRLRKALLAAGHSLDHSPEHCQQDANDIVEEALYPSDDPEKFDRLFSAFQAEWVKGGAL